MSSLAAGTRVRIADAYGVPVDMVGTLATVARRAGWPREAYWLVRDGAHDHAFGPYYLGELDVLTVAPNEEASS